MRIKSHCNTLSLEIGNWKLEIPRRSGAGFTLIELLLVIAVVSILMLTVMFAINPFEQLKKANDSRRKSDLSETQKALELYYQDNGSYPTATNGNIDWGPNASAYIASTPKDPKSPSMNYVYVSTDGDQAYVIYASLERGDKDPQACSAANPCHMVDVGVNTESCGGLGCNFGVASPNTKP